MSHYIPLESTSSVDQILAASHEGPQVILKHSTSCSISSLAKARVDKALATNSIELPVHYLDLLRYREVSNYVAKATGVRHESPQIIIVDKGEVKYQASHLDIDPYAFAVAA